MSRAERFIVAGRGACVHGTAHAGIAGVELMGAPVCGPLLVSGAGAGRAEVTRQALTRWFDAGGTAVTETVVVSPDAPAVLLEWRVASAARLQVEMQLSSELHVRVDGASLRVESSDLAANVHDAAASWSVRSDRAGCCCTFASDVVPDAPLRMVLGSASSGSVPRPEAIVRARTAALDRWAQDLLAFTAPPDIADAFEWAKLRLDAAFVMGRAPRIAAGRPRGVGPQLPSAEEAAWCGIAAAVLGRTADAHRAAHFIAELNGAGGEAASLAFELLVLARVAAVEGDAAQIADAWPRAQKAFRELIACDADGDGLVESHSADGRRALRRDVAALGVAALRELGPVAELAGDMRTTQECATRAKQAALAYRRASFVDADDRTTEACAMLPVVLGISDPATGRDWFEQMVRVPSEIGLLPHGAAGNVHSPLATGLAAWAGFLVGRREAGDLLYALLAQARQGVIGAWSDIVHADGMPAGMWPDHPASAALAVLPLIHGLIGFVPDAARQRATLRPCIPANWPDLAVNRLPIGDARVRMSCRTEGRVQRIEVEQTTGAAPLRLVLEPELQGTLASARLDGMPVALDVRFDGARRVVPIQFDLASPRILELVRDEEAG